jgi:oxygen-dependent protoporphyrinogen oxidase
MFLTPRFGMIRLVEMLARRMLEVELKTNTPVDGIERTGRGWTVRSKQGDIFPADALCVALPAHAAAALLKSAAPAAARDMEGISCESAATVTMAFNKADLPVPFSGFGFVVPAGRAGGVVGCTFSSHKFATGLLPARCCCGLSSAGRWLPTRSARRTPFWSRASGPC